MRLIIILLLVISFSPLQAQINDYKAFNFNILTGLLMQHGDNKFWYNPAAIGENEYKTITFAVSPNSTTNSYASTLTYELPSQSNKSAFALQLNNYRAGVYRPVQLRSHVKYTIDSSIYDTIFIDNTNLAEAAVLYSKTFFIDDASKSVSAGSLCSGNSGSYHCSRKIIRKEFII